MSLKYSKIEKSGASLGGKGYLAGKSRYLRDGGSPLAECAFVGSGARCGQGVLYLRGLLYKPHRTGVAVDFYPLAIGDLSAGVAQTDDGRDAIFACDDGAVAQGPADFGDEPARDGGHYSGGTTRSARCAGLAAQ